MQNTSSGCGSHHQAYRTSPASNRERPKTFFIKEIKVKCFWFSHLNGFLAARPISWWLNRKASEGKRAGGDIGELNILQSKDFVKLTAEDERQSWLFVFLSFSGSFCRPARGLVWPWVSGWVGKSISIHLSTPLPTSSRYNTETSASYLQSTIWHSDLWQVLACDYRGPEGETDVTAVQSCWVKCSLTSRKDVMNILVYPWNGLINPRQREEMFLITVQKA